MNEIMIVDNVSKMYRLGVYGGGTLKADLQSAVARVRHKEDPNLKLGAQLGHIVGDRLIALSEVSFSVNEGNKLGVIGRNGAGKSTLLKLITGVTAPTEGQIFLNGNVASMLEVGTGFHKELTGRENVYLNGAILGMTKNDIDQCFDRIVEFSEVGDFIDTQVKRYSSGMFVKLAFSVAAHLRSEIMIMDEVLAVGDMSFQNKCIEKMNEVSRNDGKTILYVSHNMNTIRQLCDSCVVLEQGKLIFEGGIEESINKYIGSLQLKFATKFLTADNRRTTNSMNLVTVKEIELEDKKVNIYNTHEPISVHLKYSSQINRSRVKIMLIVFSKEGIRLGMTESDTFEIKAGAGEKSFIFSPNVLPDGDYYTELNIIERNPLGGYDKYEGVCEAFSFHIHNEEKLIIGQEWNSAIWGNTVYPTIVMQ